MEGRFNGGFFPLRDRGLIFGGAYTWRGLFSEFYGISNFGPLQRMSRVTKHVSKACKVDSDDRVTLPVKFACKPELTLTGLLL